MLDIELIKNEIKKAVENQELERKRIHQATLEGFEQELMANLTSFKWQFNFLNMVLTREEIIEILTPLKGIGINFSVESLVTGSKFTGYSINLSPNPPQISSEKPEDAEWKATLYKIWPLLKNWKFS